MNGIINGTTANSSIKARVVWEATTNIAANTSTVKATLSYYKNSTYDGATYSRTFTGSLTINGNKKAINKYDENRIYLYADAGWVEMGSHTVEVPHNNDGTKTITISATGYMSGTSFSSTTLSDTIELETITRKATITAAPDFNDEGNPTITYSNLAGNDVDSLDACISLDGSADDIAYRDISKTGTTYTFNLTAAERNVLRNATTTSNSRNVRFYVRTVIGGTTYTSYLTKTLTVINNKPTLSPTVKDVDSRSLDLTKDENIIFKGITDAAFTFGATALKGATIKSYKVVCGDGKTSTASSGTLTDVESNVFTFTVTDSRGNSASKTITKEYIDYVKLTCNIKGRLSSDGVMTLTVNGNYFNGAIGTTQNSMFIQYRIRESGGEWGEWTAQVPNKNGNTYSGTYTISGLNYKITYEIQASAFDAISFNVLSNIATINSYPVFDWGKDDFNFNVNVSFPNSIADANIGIRSTNSNGTSVSALVPCTAEDTLMLGWGNYNAGIGRTNIYGNDINLYTKDGEGTITANGTVNINGRAYAENKVLWSGEYYMTAEHTIQLSSTVSAQPHGIVLVFSRYANGAADDANFNSFFVPKYQATEFSGTGMCFQMATVNFSVVAAKYLYIGDTQIKGNDLNSATGTGTSGIKYENNAYVLRYVIGV